MRSSRYDLHMKVPGRSRPFYIIRRRILDGGFECNCPRWVEQRKECRHVTMVKPMFASMPQVASPIDRAIEEAIRTYPYYIHALDVLLLRLKDAVREAVGKIES